VSQDAPIMLVAGQEGLTHRHDCIIETLDFELDVLGKTAMFRMDVAQEHAKLSDMAVPARDLATKLSLLMLDRLRKSGKHIPCRKGCSACCSYLVPLSIPEVFRLREEVSAMPSDRGNAVLKTSLTAARRILDRMPEDSGEHGAVVENDHVEMDQLSLWYGGLALECPFLCENLCSCYDQRPVACREHMVTSAKSCCGTEGADEPSAVRIPASVLECLGKLTAELEQTDVEAVMLPLALPWAQEHLDRSRRTWPAVTMVEQFIEILTALAEEASPADAHYSLVPQQRQFGPVRAQISNHQP